MIVVADTAMVMVEVGDVFYAAAVAMVVVVAAIFVGVFAASSAVV